jgi:hypothetical protein
MALVLKRAGKLGDQTINRFAAQDEYSKIIAELSLLSTVKAEAIEPLISNPQPAGIIVVCKASRLKWPMTAMIIRNRPNCAPISKPELKEIFKTLSLSKAQRTIRFWEARSSAKNIGAPETAVATSDI